MMILHDCRGVEMQSCPSGKVSNFNHSMTQGHKWSNRTQVSTSLLMRHTTVNISNAILHSARKDKKAAQRPNYGLPWSPTDWQDVNPSYSCCKVIFWNGSTTPLSLKIWIITSWRQTRRPRVTSKERFVTQRQKIQPKDQWSRKLQNTPIILSSLSYALMLSRLSRDTGLNCTLICIIVHINVPLWIFIFVGFFGGGNPN